ncbi:MAG: oligosaccharide flippase family protein [Chloroflexota bacterium]
MPIIIGLNSSELMLQRRSVSINTLALVGGNVGSLLLAFALSVIIGRGLGQVGLGVYVAVLAWVFPLLMLAEFGTNTLLTRDLAKSPADTPAYLNAVAPLRYRIGAGLGVLLFLAAPMLSDNPTVITGLRVSAPLLLIEPSYGAYTAVLRAHQAMLPIPLLNVGMLIVQVLGSLLIIDVGGDAVALLALNTITSLLRMIGAWWAYRRGGYGNGVVGQVPSGLVARALPFAVAGVLAALHMRLNVLLIAPISGVAAVGVYAAGMRFIEAARVVPAAYYDAILPKLAAMPKPQFTMRYTPHVFTDEVNAGVWLMAIYGLLVGVGATLAGPTFVRWTYGGDFSASVQVLVLAAWLLGFALVSELWLVREYASGLEWKVNRALILMLAVGVGLGVLVIPQWGVLGAVLAWWLAEVVGLVSLTTGGLTGALRVGLGEA